MRSTSSRGTGTEQGPVERLRVDQALVDRHVGQEHGELVAPQAGHQPRRLGAQPLPALGDQPVPRAVAERVVDVLEVVEVQQQHDAACVVAGHGDTDRLVEGASVGQAREGVVQGVVRALLHHLLQTEGRCRPVRPATAA